MIIKNKAEYQAVEATITTISMLSLEKNLNKYEDHVLSGIGSIYDQYICDSIRRECQRRIEIYDTML